MYVWFGKRQEARHCLGRGNQIGCVEACRIRAFCQGRSDRIQALVGIITIRQALRRVLGNSRYRCVPTRRSLTLRITCLSTCIFLPGVETKVESDIVREIERNEICVAVTACLGGDGNVFGVRVRISLSACLGSESHFRRYRTFYGYHVIIYIRLEVHQRFAVNLNIRQSSRVIRRHMRRDGIYFVCLGRVNGLHGDGCRLIDAAVDYKVFLLGIVLGDGNDIQLRRTERQINIEVRRLAHIQRTDTVNNDSRESVGLRRVCHFICEGIGSLRAVFCGHNNRRRLAQRCLRDDERLLGFSALYRQCRRTLRAVRQDDVVIGMLTGVEIEINTFNLYGS